MPTELLTPTRHRAEPTFPPPSVRREHDEVRAAETRYAGRVRRFKRQALVWAIGSVVATSLWIVVEWTGNGAFERFAHEGNQGDWNPTLWALVVGIWGLVIGIMALRVHFERPLSVGDVDRAVEQRSARFAAKGAVGPEVRRFVRKRLEGVRRLKFHLAAWALGMLVIAPLNALIEWQDNGGFERVSSDSQPGSWDPWVLYIGGIWACVIVGLALALYADRPKRVRR